MLVYVGHNGQIFTSLAGSCPTVHSAVQSINYGDVAVLLGTAKCTCDYAQSDLKLLMHDGSIVSWHGELDGWFNEL